MVRPAPNVSLTNSKNRLGIAGYKCHTRVSSLFKDQGMGVDKAKQLFQSSQVAFKAGNLEEF